MVNQINRKELLQKIPKDRDKDYTFAEITARKMLTFVNSQMMQTVDKIHNGKCQSERQVVV